MNDWMEAYWDAVARQDEAALRAFFAPDALIRWHCTNEQFDLDGFLRANCDYPGSWNGKLERMEPTADGFCTAARVWSPEFSCHVASFFHMNENGLIQMLDEYWGDDGPAPVWRQRMNISRPINQEEGKQDD